MTTTDAIRLNIGAGETKLPGFIPIDAKTGGDALHLDYGDGTVAEIYASHLLEHLDRKEAWNALVEWFRALKPGGRIRIAVPDFRVLAKYGSESDDPLILERVEMSVMGAQMDKNDFHKSQYTFRKLYRMMDDAGFDLIKTWQAEYLDTAAQDISLRLEAVKPNPDRVPIKLNIGGGSTEIRGFTNIDIKEGIDASGRLPYDDNSVDEVYASHVLEHIHHSKVRDSVKEWHRVLKPGGFIRIAVPDYRKLIDHYRHGRIGMEKLTMWAHGSVDHDTDRHQCEFDEAMLFQLLRSIGFDDVHPWQAVYQDCSTIDVSLNLCGVKRTTLIRENPKVVLVLSRPRFGPSHMMESVILTVRQAGWDYIHHGGTVWGKGMEGVCEKAIAECNPDYIMCLDYDSVFTAEDCFEMLRLMQENPDIGAMYPVEAHRHADRPLGFDPTRSYEGETTQVSTGHFGCTIIRREVFDTIPHPWFFCLPNQETGRWEGSVDDDIYFWLQCGIYGFRVCQANEVQIGHMEWCVKWMSDQSKTGIGWQPIQNYEKIGKPAWAKFDMKKWQAKFGETAFKKNPVKQIEPSQNGHAASHAPEAGSGALPPSPIHQEDTIVSVS